MINIIIGPNGYGKSFRLEEIKNEQIKKYGSSTNILFFESELLLSNEIKDTKDDTKIMEFIFDNIISTPKIETYKKKLEEEIDNEIACNKMYLNEILNQSLIINKSVRKEPNIIEESSKKTYKNLVNTKNKDYLSSFGSGQRMYFLLSLINETKKDVIILDEPEKHAHPSLLNKIANIIKNLDEKGKEIYIATNSPKLISMLDLELDNITVINSSNHELKKIPYDEICKKLSEGLHVSNFPDKSKFMYRSGENFKKIIKKLYYREFIESLFSSKVYICEGINDEFFIKEILRRKELLYSEYSIFKTHGKYHMPLFIDIYNFLNIDCYTFFDGDSIESTKDLEANNYIQNNSNSTIFTLESENKNHNRLESVINYKCSKENVSDFSEYLENCDLSRFIFDKDEIDG